MKFSIRNACVALFFLLGFSRFANAACQVAADPDSLVMSIAEAGKKSSVSTEVLRMMLPCPGKKVKAAGLAALLDSKFTADQIAILRVNFAFAPPTLGESLAIAKTSAPVAIREEVLNFYPKLAVSVEDLDDLAGGAVTREQTALVAAHVTVTVSESDFIRGMSMPSNKGRSRIFRASLTPITLTSEGAVASFFKYSDRAELAGRVFISDPALWAFAVKNGAGVADLTRFVSCKDREMREVFRAFQAAEIPDVIAADLVTHNPENIHLRERDIGFVSMAVIPSGLVDKMFLSLKHDAISVDPVTIARLKAHGVSDEAILALGADKARDLVAPATVIQADNYGDLFAKISPLSGDSGSSSRESNFWQTGPYRVGGDVSAPILVSKTEPEYSEAARSVCKQGKVLLSLVVGADGIAQGFHVLRPLGSGLDEKAIEAIKKWRFRPGMKGGRFVATQATIEVTFGFLGACTPATPKSSDLHANKSKPPIWSKPKTPDTLRVQIMQTQWNSTEFGTSGYGKGNLTEDGSAKGFNFTFLCTRPFLPSDGEGYYPAHWKKPGTRLVIATTEVGNPNKHESCELRVTLQPFTFQMQNGQLYTYNTH